MDDVAGLRRQHCLHVVVHVAQHDTVPLTARAARLLVAQRLDLQTLEDGDGELLLALFGVAEDDTGEKRSVSCRDID